MLVFSFFPLFCVLYVCVCVFGGYLFFTVWITIVKILNPRKVSSLLICQYIDCLCLLLPSLFFLFEVTLKILFEIFKLCMGSLTG